MRRKRRRLISRSADGLLEGEGRPLGRLVLGEGFVEFADALDAAGDQRPKRRYPTGLSQPPRHANKPGSAAGRHVGRAGGFEGADVVGLLHGQADVIETFEEAMLHLGVHSKRNVDIERRDFEA